MGFIKPVRLREVWLAFVSLSEVNVYWFPGASAAITGFYKGLTFLNLIGDPSNF